MNLNTGKDGKMLVVLVADTKINKLKKFWKQKINPKLRATVRDSDTNSR